MGVMDDLQAETDALREFLRELAQVMTTSTDAAPTVRHELTLAWQRAEGVVQANETFLDLVDPPVGTAEDFLNITLQTRTSLVRVAPMIEALKRSRANTQT